MSLDFSIIEVNLLDIVFDESIYPRVKGHTPKHVQSLFENLQSIENEDALIVVNQDLKILNGRHRHLAYLKRADGDNPIISVKQVETRDSLEDEDIAYELDAMAALGYTKDDRVSRCRKLYNRGYKNKTIAEMAKVSPDFATKATKQQRDDDREVLDNNIYDMWMRCYAQKHISNEVSLGEEAIQKKIKTFLTFNFKIKSKESVRFSQDNDFSPPLYNVWSYAKKTSELDHFGNSEQRIVENLLYLYTEPFDIVLDPFAGSASTLDVCKKRFRRCWISDRKPIVERADEIRKLDIATELPSLNKMWSDVSLTYLDPPYWRQAEGKYSKDGEDLANMPLEDFTRTMIDTVKRIAAKQSKGVIALLIQPTQWKSDNREFTDHVVDIIKGVNIKKLKLHSRISCPYSTEQCNPQQVNWAKENKEVLVISRELIIWKVTK